MPLDQRKGPDGKLLSACAWHGGGSVQARVPPSLLTAIGFAALPSQRSRRRTAKNLGCWRSEGLGQREYSGGERKEELRARGTERKQNRPY
jgi:hypothetical protein